jgi:hypothetical protein
MIDLTTLYEYLASAEGRMWTAEDSAYVRDKFSQVERLAEGVIERRTAEMRAEEAIALEKYHNAAKQRLQLEPMGCIGTTGGKAGTR